FADVTQRLLGPLACALLLPATVSLTAGSEVRRAARQTAVHAIGLLLALECAWVWLDPREASLWWLYFTGMTLATIAPMSALYALALPRWLPDSDWAAQSRRSGTVLGILAVLLVAGVLAQEAWHFLPGRTGPPLPEPTYVIAVAAAVCVLIVTLVL